MHVATTMSNTRLISCMKLVSMLPPDQAQPLSYHVYASAATSFDFLATATALHLPFKIGNRNHSYHVYHHYCSYSPSPLLLPIVAVVLLLCLLFVSLVVLRRR